MKKLTILLAPSGPNAVSMLAVDQQGAPYEPCQIVSKRDLVRARGRLLDRLCGEADVASVEAPGIPSWALNGSGLNIATIRYYSKGQTK